MSQKDEVQLRVARIAALAAIVGAIIGGTLTGALAFVTTNKTIASTAARDQTNFLRNQRLSVYSKISTDNADLVNRERTLVLQMDAKTTDGAALKADYDIVAKSLDQLRLDVFSVTLLATAAASRAANDLLQNHQDFYNSSAAQVDLIANQSTAENASIGNADPYNNETVPKISRNFSVFVAAARADLGVR